MTDAPNPDDRYGHLTDAQRRAVRTTGRSLLVSAAAGSGKTMVLAERCAYLVCDLEGDDRCNIDELLVVTFTDAASGEMRTRIRSAIRDRSREAPRCQHLQQQLHLLEQASISTIHSFCKTLIQRWFPQAGVDPQATVLAGDEAELLLQETLDLLLVDLYGREDDLALRFRQLVDDYGGGNDHTITQSLLNVHRFISSLPTPDQWLDEQIARIDPEIPSSLVNRIAEVQTRRLLAELQCQSEFAQSTLQTIRSCWPIAQNHVACLTEYIEHCTKWAESLRHDDPSAWETVADEIREVSFPKAASKPRGTSDEETAQYDAAKDQRERVKNLFEERLQRHFLFTADEYREGLLRVAPYVRTIVELVRELDEKYREAKDVQAAVDFNDLQRMAYNLLTVDRDPNRPSDVAKQVQRQFRHVLVDEFQDVDPLQEAILRLISRESADPPEGNLFAVGDIKQSIYRFRLAEPGLFSERAEAFDGEHPFGELIWLQHNFRSRPSIIDAVNLVFAPLMSRDFGGSQYDNRARLVAGATYPQGGDPKRTFDHPAVEMHVLEPITERTRQADAGDDDDPGADREELGGVEREAFLIARRIREWMGIEGNGERMQVAGKPAAPGEPPALRNIDYGDIVILLRSMPHKAGPIADVLRRMQIPVQVTRETGGLDSTEYRDVLSLLKLLDNRRQDIPLAAVLRSPLLGDRLNETELMRIRQHDDEVPFHAVVPRYAREGPDAELRDRLAVILTKLDRYRERIRNTPVADVLWEMLEDHDYPAYVAGLPDGARRREHLVRLHELARQFGRFHRQGLRRFLRFCDQMIERDQPMDASSATFHENAVRIMTVHTSKGLEFPVVICADMAKRFNLSDAQASILLDRRQGIALRAADADRRVLYPTLAHQLAAEMLHREDLSEELRVLYVALTRAREHLMVIARANPEQVESTRARGALDVRVPRLALESASHPLMWLLTAVGSAPRDAVQWNIDAVRRSPLFHIRVHPRAETDQWQIPPAVRPERAEDLAKVAALQPLPPDEPVAPEAEVEPLIAGIDAVYDGAELTTLTARVSVTELKRRWDASHEPDERVEGLIPDSRPVRMPAFFEEVTEPTSVRRGIATHRFLQFVDLARPCDAADLRAQLDELVAAGRLLSEDAELVMLDAAAWFFSTDQGRSLREHADRVEREVVFVSSLPADEYDPTVVPRDERDRLLLRGTVDVLIRHPDGIEILDYKTDRVDAGACHDRALGYHTQMAQYARAMAAICGRPVTRRALVFLHARQVLDLD